MPLIIIQIIQINDHINSKNMKENERQIPKVHRKNCTDVIESLPTI